MTARSLLFLSVFVAAVSASCGADDPTAVLMEVDLNGNEVSVDVDNLYVELFDADGEWGGQLFELEGERSSVSILIERGPRIPKEVSAVVRVQLEGREVSRTDPVTLAFRDGQIRHVQVVLPAPAQ